MAYLAQKDLNEFMNTMIHLLDENKKDIKEHINDVNKGHKTELDAQLLVINDSINKLNQTLIKHNGRLSKCEDEIINLCDKNHSLEPTITSFKEHIDIMSPRKQWKIYSIVVLTIVLLSNIVNNHIDLLSLIKSLM